MINIKANKREKSSTGYTNKLRLDGFIPAILYGGKVANEKISIAKFPWGASGRAQSLGSGEGLTKLIIDPKTEKIIGVGLAGKGAGELISEGVLAIEMGIKAKDLALTIHPHPTLSETLMEAAEVFYGTATHIYKKKRT